MSDIVSKLKWALAQEKDGRAEISAFDLRMTIMEIERLERDVKHHKDLVQAYSDMARAR